VDGSRRWPDWHGNTLADIAKHLLKRRVAERRPERVFNARRQAVAEQGALRQKFRGFRPQWGALGVSADQA
jgi:hypothetical protein